MGRRRFDLDARVVIIFLMFSIAFVAGGAFLIIGLVRGSLRETMEESLEQRALQTRLLLERYMGEQVIHLRLLAVDPQVRAAVAAPPAKGKAPDTQKLAQAWTSGKDAVLTLPITSSPLAVRLRDMTRVRPAVQLLQVIAADGHVIAASTRAGRFDHSEADWFRAQAQGDTSKAYIGDVHRVSGNALPLLEIDYAIVDPVSGQWLGAVQALIDAGDLYGVLAPVRIGRTGQAILLRGSDGVVLAADEGKKVLADPFPGFELIQAAIRARQAHWRIPAMEEKAKSGEKVVREERLVAYSHVEQVPNVDWIVAVEQELGEATAPVRAVSRYLWLHFFGAFGSLVAMALYVSFGLNRPVIERELHLHEEHVPKSMRRRRTDREREDEDGEAPSPPSS
jgi:hypothetical protein